MIINFNIKFFITYLPSTVVALSLLAGKLAEIHMKSDRKKWSGIPIKIA